MGNPPRIDVVGMYRIGQMQDPPLQFLEALEMSSRTCFGILLMERLFNNIIDAESAMPVSTTHHEV